MVVSSLRRNNPLALDPAIKSCNLLNNILAVREAQAEGAAEPILLNDRGDVAEGASANVFVVRAGALVTPPLGAASCPASPARSCSSSAASAGLEVREETLRVPDPARAPTRSSSPARSRK